MKKYVRFACPLDCFDACGLIATVEKGRATAVHPDPHHPLTRGKCCRKGHKILERQYHPHRLTRPLKKNRTGKGSDFQQISWQQALDVVAERLTSAKASYGPLSVLNYADSGYGGLIKTVDEMFFNYYGGVTVRRGSLCWGAGIAAQRYDFGGVKSHHPEDLTHAKTIILWGRNPMATNLHLVQYLRAAQKSGAQLILIDPIKSETAVLADDYIGIKPAADGALALAMACTILEENLVDLHFIENHVLGFEPFADYVRRFSPERASDLTGIHPDVIRRLARQYAQRKPAAVILGYGPQRYQNGGSTIRCIDALGALTGNIGVSGGGVNYADKSMSGYIAGEVPKSRAYASSKRSFALPRLADFLETADNPPVECMFVSGANPLVQIGHISKTLNAWQAIGLKVVFDHFMTDTARFADLVLPVTTVLEEVDIIYSSMFSPYLNYSHQAVDPPPGVMSEYDFFMSLARLMNLPHYPMIDKEEFLKRAIAPLTDHFGLTLDALKSAPFCLPVEPVCWQDGKFDTPSGKYELYSQKAANEGAPGLPQFIPPTTGSKAYPLRLITPHWKYSMHSQHFAFISRLPTGYANGRVLDLNGLKPDQTANIISSNGVLRIRIKQHNGVPDDVVMIHQGWWHHSGSVNFLTPDAVSDIGEQAAFYDCFCRLEKA